MRYFKLPIIVTSIAFTLAVAVGLVVVTIIHRAQLSNREKEERAQKLGAGVAGVTLLVVTPFWLVAAAKLGKQRRQARNQPAIPQEDPE